MSYYSKYIRGSWIENACIPGTEEYLGMQHLKAYGFDLTKSGIQPSSMYVLMVICGAGTCQQYVDALATYKPEHLTRVWQLLRSWNISVSRSRLEMNPSSVFALFASDIVLNIPGHEKPMVRIENFLTIILGDYEAIKESWKDNHVSGYASLTRGRLHVHTLLHLCLTFDHKMFVELWNALMGPPPDRVEAQAMDERIARECNPKRMVDTLPLSIADTVEAAYRRKRNKRLNYRRSLKERKRVQKLLDERNANVDGMCVVCLDEAPSVRFIPCGHACCCSDCGDMLLKCCLCRADITGREEVKEEVKEKEVNKKSYPAPPKFIRTKRGLLPESLQNATQDMTVEQIRVFLFHMLVELERKISGHRLTKAGRSIKVREPLGPIKRRRSSKQRSKKRAQSLHRRRRRRRRCRRGRA
jgi:hypothetical protein